MMGEGREQRGDADAWVGRTHTHTHMHTVCSHRLLHEPHTCGQTETTVVDISAEAAVTQMVAERQMKT